MPADFIPRKNLDFATFQHNLVNQVVAHAAAWGISAGSVAELVAASGKYTHHYNAISNKGERTMAHVAGHNQERKNFEKTLRQFVNAYIRGNTQINEEQMAGMMLRHRRKKRTVREYIHHAPEVWIQVKGGMVVKIYCRQVNTAGKAAVHPEADGIELRYSLGTAATRAAQATEVLFTKKAKNKIQLPLTQQGKKLYLFARWLNLTTPDRSSPWSEVQEAMVF